MCTAELEMCDSRLSLLEEEEEEVEMFLARSCRIRDQKCGLVCSRSEL